MILLDYVLSKKRDKADQALCDLVLGLAESQAVDIQALSSAWFLGRADGAKCSRIILSDEQGNEFLLPVHLASVDEELEVQGYLGDRCEVGVQLLQGALENTGRVEVPIRVFDSEVASIKAAMGKELRGEPS